ncbi:unnamed protein product, partial [Heterotrigona itama]
QPQPKNHLPKPENGTNPDDITFTTSQPETPRSKTIYRQQWIHSNVPSSNKRILKIRTDWPMMSRSSGGKGNRRRRQLQHTGAKTSAIQVGQSYDFSENYIENQQKETVQGPAEAFDEGAVRIEPVYRVTKNRNIFDSIVDVIRKIVDPPKALGPFVGPFHFPGIGDKVYIRLLEPLNSNHLVIRLISNLPVTEIESTFDKDILPSSEVIEHPDVPTIGYESTNLPLSSEGSIVSHHSDVHSILPDNALSTSNNVAQVSKPSLNAGHTTGYPAENHSLRTYKLNFKHGNINDIQSVKHRNPSSVSSLRHGHHVNSALRSKLADQANKMQINQYLSSGFQDHPYPFYSSLNESNKEHSKLLTVDFQQLQTPSNLSIPEYVTYNGPVNLIEKSPNKGIPTSAGEGSDENRPKYSIEFASKNMRYLNLDGSVESAVKKTEDEGFKPMELAAVYSKVPRPVDYHWKAFEGTNVQGREEVESSTSKQNHGGLQERSDSNVTDAFLQTFRKSSSHGMNYSRGTAANKRAVKSTSEQGSRCCWQEKMENKSARFSFEGQPRDESRINDSTISVESTSRSPIP